MELLARDSLRIVHIEDDHDFALLSERTLRKAGFTQPVVQCPDGVFALHYFATMEAEAELPPMVVRALRSKLKAKAGWERMTPTQRRSELMGVFYYQTPEARERRVQKLVEAAERRAADD